jgi:hypothetical protein
LPEAGSIYRIGIFGYIPALSIRQRPGLPDDPGISEELTQALGHLGGYLAISVLGHEAVHDLMGHGGTEPEHRQVS